MHASGPTGQHLKPYSGPALSSSSQLAIPRNGQPDADTGSAGAASLAEMSEQCRHVKWKKDAQDRCGAHLKCFRSDTGTNRPDQFRRLANCEPGGFRTLCLSFFVIILINFDTRSFSLLYRTAADEGPNHSSC